MKFFLSKDIKVMSMYALKCVNNKKNKRIYISCFVKVGWRGDILFLQQGPQNVWDKRIWVSLATFQPLMPCEGSKFHRREITPRWPVIILYPSCSSPITSFTTKYNFFSFQIFKYIALKLTVVLLPLRLFDTNIFYFFSLRLFDDLKKSYDNHIKINFLP